MNSAKIIATLVILTLILSGYTNPDRSGDYPGNYNLFKIDRSRDRDIVLYDVRLDSLGNLDSSGPISAYWKKFTENGRYEPLTMIQQKFGYGIRFHNISESVADFQLVSFQDQLFRLRKNKDNEYRVYLVSGGKNIELRSLYIQFEDDSFWFPEISRIEIKGMDLAEGGLVTEIIIPGEKHDQP